MCMLAPVGSASAHQATTAARTAGTMPTDPVIVITPDGTDTITAITVSTNGMRTESGYREPEEESHIGGLFFFVLAAASAPFPRRGPERGPPTDGKSDHAPLGG